MFLSMDKFLRTSNLHSLCVSHAFLMYHLYDGRIGSSEPKKYGHKEDGISGFCSHQPSTANHLTNACAQIEMKCNHPRNKWPTFPLFTCSLSFFLIFLKGRKSSVTPRCGVGSLIYKNQILFPNFFIMIVNLQ